MCVRLSGILRLLFSFGLLGKKSTMSSQAKISTFFRSQARAPLQDKVNEPDNTTESSKRQRDENCRVGISSKDSSPRKKPRSAGDSGLDVGTSSSQQNKATEEANTMSLSPQQKAVAENNKLKAKIKLVKKQTFGLVDDIGLSWFVALEAEFSKPSFLKLAKFIEDERKQHTVYPAPADVFSWTRMTQISDTKVVILGQDPYHGPNQAHGLCFSVQKGIALPPSLENMYKELCTDIDGFTRPSHGCLVGWAQQGVLLLNAVLTVRAHCPNSHKDQGWEVFTDAVIAWLNENTSGSVFMLWGAYAHKKGARINKKKHHVLQGVHPSPLSAYRGFFGCRHFSRCNELLKNQGKEPIDWSRFV